jgi:thymidylate synthase (FAD)
MQVDLINHMGSDLTVVNSAKVSFDKESEWDYPGEKWGPDHFIKMLSEKDQKLIKYLANHNHWTPFSHVQITMREKVPIFVARQRFKHMVGFSYNEVSRRYVDDTPEFFTPDAWRKRAENKKQGSSDEIITDLVQPWEDADGASVSLWYQRWMEDVEFNYNKFLEWGVAPEQARMILPQSMYTSYYTTGSLAAWARAYKLRSDPHSQKEIQDLAAMWHKTISGIKELEHSWKALTS